MTSSDTTLPTVLIVRHLPSELSVVEKEDLLQHFGATNVRCMGTRGHMKHTAFATFCKHSEAVSALNKLHQLDVLGHKLVVEFAKYQHVQHYPFQPESKRPEASANSKETEEDEKSKSAETENDTFEKQLHAFAPQFGLDQPMNSKLKYLYPPPSLHILTNIANALASVPRFYTQVLHLMNKMNLPAPFGAVTPTPDLPSGDEEKLHVKSAKLNSKQQLPDIMDEENMEVSSSEEGSELESDEESKSQKVDAEKPLAPKRPIRRPQKRISKRLKLQHLIKQQQYVVPSTTVEPTKATDVFDVTDAQPGKKLEIKVTCDTLGEKPNEQNSAEAEEAAEQFVVAEGGFGQFAPLPADTEVQSDEYTEAESTEFISQKELHDGRMSPDKMKHLSVFKNYDPGDPTNRLYLKNLAKQVEEKIDVTLTRGYERTEFNFKDKNERFILSRDTQDLRYIYGRYVDFSVELEKDMFDIRLMKEGKMKGQAFITLVDDKKAGKARHDTNGFALHGKPIVVQFARSARPKEDPKDTNKKST